MSASTQVRRPLAGVLAGLLLLGFAGAAAAKFPYFSVAIDPAQPRPDEPVTLTVRFWADAAHSKPAGFTYDGALPELIGFRRTGGGSGPARVPVELEMVKTDLLRGEVRLPAGEWRLVSFPHGQGALGDPGPGYPQPIDVVVREAADPTGWLLLLAGGGTVGVAATAAWRRGRRPCGRVGAR